MVPGTLSLLLYALPFALKTRLSDLNRMRRSFIDRETAPGERRSDSRTPTRPCTPATESEMSAINSSTTSRTASISGDEFREGVLASRRPGGSPAMDLDVTGPLPDQGSGVDWRSGQIGVRLAHTAFEEASRPTSTYAPDLERKIYVDGLSYLLKALPCDLDEPETMILRRSLPPSLLAPPDNQMVLTDGTPTPAERPLLRRAVQTLVIQLIVLTQILVPYLMSLARLAAETERKHKVSEKFIVSTIGLADFCGKQSVSLTEAVCRMGGPRSQQALTEGVAWVVEGISGGISDGIGEGLARIGTRDQ